MSAIPKQQILLVDDEPQILIALEDLLCDQFTVHKATSAESALVMMEERSDIAVVVTDQRMPQMPGDELVARLNEHYAAQRIMVTGYADLSAVVRAVNDGRIFAYVTKPWNEEDLRLKVSKAAEQFRLSEELAKEKKLLDDLMDYSPDGIFFKNRELKFIRANRVTAGWLRQEIDDLVGKRLRDLSPAVTDAKDIEREEQRSLDTGIPLLDVVRHIDADDGGHWISERKAPIKSRSGEVLGLVGISRDITGQRELEQQLIQSQKMEAVGRLAGGVAHDFNNLLAIIQSYGSLVLDGLPQGSSSREDMGELLLATERAKALTGQLLTFSRRRPVNMVPVDLNHVVRDVEKMASRLLDGKIKMRMVLKDRLPPLCGDVNQLEQVLLNLAINARDAMPSGGDLELATDRVRAAFDAQGKESDYLCLSVRDTGSGMSPEVQKRIFEPFYSTKEVGKGTGLGLSTVYGIVRQWGGHIRVESKLGTGTCFKLYFPAVAAQVEEDAPRSRASAPTPPSGQKTILLLEDDEAVRRVAARIMRAEGYHVIEASLPSEARKTGIETSTHIDLLVSDVNMPETTGPKLAEELVAVRPDLKLLFMSGYTEGSASTPTPTLSAAHYLEKPFSPVSLAAAVRAALEK